MAKPPPCGQSDCPDPAFMDRVDGMGSSKQTKRHRHYGGRSWLWGRRVLRSQAQESEDAPYRPLGQGGLEVHQRILLGFHLHPHQIFLPHRDLRLSRQEHGHCPSQFSPDHTRGYLYPTRYAQTSRVQNCSSREMAPRAGKPWSRPPME